MLPQPKQREQVCRCVTFKQELSVVGAVMGAVVGAMCLYVGGVRLSI